MLLYLSRRSDAVSELHGAGRPTAELHGEAVAVPKYVELGTGEKEGMGGEAGRRAVVELDGNGRSTDGREGGVNLARNF